ncbi:MAG: endolytic transglycosylase MltG [Rickettsiales bacterium]|nr:endolytic transglycosylase MltG [Rickettsiales bacterium]
MKYFLLVVALIGLVSLGIFAYLWDDYYAPGPLTEPKTVLFKRGHGFRQIVDDLGEQGVIRYPLVFKAIAALTGDARKFKAGEYYFTTAIPPAMVMGMIAQGKVVVHKVTVAEGLTVQEINALLTKETLLEGDVPTGIEEGSLLPETYYYTYGDNRADIIHRMQAAMQATLNELWDKRRTDTPLTTRQDIITLASIVEKETGLPSERPLVASVFMNRLRLGMKLQTDPTVIYAITKGQTSLGRALTLADLETDSPYNTYKYAGLPPGPIANPGRASIEAALNPLDSNYLYFVATGNGGHNFAATLQEHNKNVADYRRSVKKVVQ